MKTAIKYRSQINNILNELQEASIYKINTNYENTDNQNSPSKILVINGIINQYTPLQYFYFLKELNLKSIEQLRALLPYLPLAERVDFFEHLQRKIRRIIQANLRRDKLDHGYCTAHNISTQNRRNNCSYYNRRLKENISKSKGINKTGRYSFIYYLFLLRLEFLINCTIGASLVSTAPGASNEQGENKIKFKLNCTVAFFGAMLRVLYDRNMFDKPNVAELCRQITRLVYTDRQDTISPHSLRNSFESPDPKILLKVVQEFNLCVKYAEKFISRTGL